MRIEIRTTKTKITGKNYQRSGSSTETLHSRDLPGINAQKTRSNLHKILTPFCQGIQDIYGRKDINDFDRHPNVETSHYKLWLTSVPVLQRLLRHGTAVWNAMTKEDIERKMSLYVQTGAYEAARAILMKNNYCILSGIPGIGKTTLAQVLVIQINGPTLRVDRCGDDIKEARPLDPSRRQVVYYDDFLGQSSMYEKLGKNEDKSIVRLLQESQRSKHLKGGLHNTPIHPRRRKEG